MTKLEKKTLKALENYLNKLAGNKEGCGLSDEVKKSCKLYIESWMLPLVEILQKDSEERTADETGLLKIEAYY